MKKQILIGGKAGQGPNIITQILGEVLIERGFYVFHSREYQSLIRGGHNFNVLTFSDEPVFSNEFKSDILICLDEETEKIHKLNLNKDAIILNSKEENMYFAGRIFKLLSLSFEELQNKIEKMERRKEENLAEAKKGFLEEKRDLMINRVSSKKIRILNGSQGISEGAIKSGLEFYYAYPMTPATPLLIELAQASVKHKTIELENEIAVVMAGMGSAILGKNTMVGTSGGGFDLMTEGLSMACQAEIPLVMYLSSRPGPGTGVATATSQGDLNIALYSGHGESFRIVLAPGDPEDALEITNRAFYLSNKYKLPSIILSDKHLSESYYTCENLEKINEIKNNLILKKYNSYEHTSDGIASEKPSDVVRGFEKRIEKQKEVEKESEKFSEYKIFGKKDSKNLIISYGSTKGAILDAIKNLDVKFIQILSLQPFPEKISKELESAKKILIVENNSTSPFSNLIRDKTGIKIDDKNKILKYDGFPFLSDELKKEIEKRLR